jgi:hypothetical protein
VQRVADLISGADIRYDHMEAWAPDIEGLPRSGRPLLLGGAGEAAAGAPWRDRVDFVAGQQPMLLRPDFYVAWRPGSGWSLEEALRRWFGEPSKPQLS